MKTIKIPKKTKGKFRLIYVPDFQEKVKLRSMLGEIEKKCTSDAAHGFRVGRSPVTNAQQHVGYKYTTCMDLADFFDSVGERHLKGRLSNDELAAVLVDGAPRQGLPTSPAVANLAAEPMDKAILKWIKKSGHTIVYTRYADDLAFSYGDPAVTDKLNAAVKQIVTRCGFKLNPDKTRTMCATEGRRTITGVAVGPDGVHVPRRIKRRLRAAEHQNRINQARGLREWSKMKLPDGSKRQTRDELKALSAAWNIRYKWSQLPQKTEAEDLGENCIVTPDPVYMLGMSNWTTGWRSCMRHPGGQYRKGVGFWLMNRGTRLACYQSDSTMTVGGVTRRKMRARCLVHELRDGTKVYDRVYGNVGDTDHLTKQLRAAGYIHTTEARSGTKVVGHAPARWRVYCDTLSAVRMTASAGRYQGQKVKIVKIS